MQLRNKHSLLFVVLGVLCTGMVLFCVDDAAVPVVPGDVGCAPGQVLRDNRCLNDADLAYCVSLINEYRAQKGLGALLRSDSLEEFAATGAQYDAARNTAHAHFSAEAHYTLTDAENEIPGWRLSARRTVRSVIEEGTRMMWNEGPGGGHYENIVGNHTRCGCGYYITVDSALWVVQDFK